MTNLEVELEQVKKRYDQFQDGAYVKTTFDLRDSQVKKIRDWRRENENIRI